MNPKGVAATSKDRSVLTSHRGDSENDDVEAEGEGSDVTDDEDDDDEDDGGAGDEEPDGGGDGVEAEVESSEESTRRFIHSPRSEEEDEDIEGEEDSSDMDVEECDRKRYEYVDDLTDLEKQFAVLREQLYRERITQIEAKLAEVRAGKAAEYLQPLEELQINMKNRLEVGGILKELRIKNIQCKFEAEQLAARQNFESEKQMLWDSIKADLEEKIHILEEDKSNVDFSTGLWEQLSSGRSRKRRADPSDPDRKKKPLTVSGPFIIYLLQESDIMDDWRAIRKAMTQRRKPAEIRL